LPTKVRVYELAKELGISNKEVITLCNDLGIGVKSHSSSVVDAQADRVRRKAERAGLVKDAPKSSPKASPAKKNDVAKKVSSKKPPVKKKSIKPEPIKKIAEAPIKSVAAKTNKPANVFSSSGRSSATPDRISTPPPRVAQMPEYKAPQPKQKPKPKPIKPIKVVKPVKAKVEKVVEPKVEKAPQGKKSNPNAKPAGNKPSAPSTDKSGKPIPPPPPRKIPPPPQFDKKAASAGGGNRYGGSRPGGSRPGGSRPGGSRPGGSRPGGSRPSTGSRLSGGAGNTGGFNRGPSMPGGGPGSSPGGRPGGGGPPRGRGGPNRGGPNRGRPRRKSRKRRSSVELTPMDLPTYTAEDAPVPQGIVVIERSSTAQDLAEKLNRSAADVVRLLLTNGEMVTATQSLSDEMIELFATDVGAEIRLVNPGEEQEVEMLKLLEFDEESVEEVEEDLISRPPVVTVMGHVDHGKTKLLDRIRSANVVDGEAGGITQHIGAYQIEHNGKKITFLDTPGHEAFTAMRARGANATDIVILVVAADDGVMPQTLEALDHAKAAEVPIIVAINKIDREGADPQRVIAQLGERGLVPEAWGGDTIMSEVSALKGDGMDGLMDNLLLVAEVEDLKASQEGPASGVVLESHLDIGRGSVATVIVEKGILNVGDPMVTGGSWGRVRALVTDRGENVVSAGPSAPVQVLGLSDVASAGDKFMIAPTEKVAAKVADTRAHWQRVSNIGRTAHASSGAKLEDIFNRIQAGEVATLNLVVKADVNGSLEAVCDSLKKLERDEVKLSFMLRGVGGITENDVQLAAASNATIIGFNVRPDRKARDLAAQEKVEIRNYEIIYKLIEDIQAAMLGMLAPEFEEVVTGEAEVREIFGVPKIGKIAGVMVTNGVITRGSKVRFLREGTIIWKGDIESLKRFKEDAKEVASGFECGIGLSDFQDLKEGDIIETYDVKEIERTLD